MAGELGLLPGGDPTSVDSLNLILNIESPATSHVAGFVILILVDQSS
jgi:hypothetical protein